MNKKKILTLLLSASIIGTGVNIFPMKTLADWRSENNTWTYIENGQRAIGWKLYDNTWYYFNDAGIMQTGWLKDNETWYYLSESGAMKIGWVKDNGAWYYLSESGAMKTGWVKDNGAWYYLSESGAMETGWLKDNETWYYLSESGAMKTGWLKDNNNWYYLSGSGAMQTGTISVADKVYYLNESGAMQTGKININGKVYEFNINGEAVGEIPPVANNKVFEHIEKTDESMNNITDITNYENKEDNSSSSSSSGSSGNSGSSSDNNQQENKQWNLVWQDSFEGDKLDLENWSYEKHEPGWVNNELQEYTDSEDNTFIKDGNLVIKAIETEKDGKKHYTSGRITTQNKQTFKYGKFEIRAKFPKGQGLLPALWLMPNDESLYGQWPKCGEIDMAEVLGHEPEKLYGTIHYGEPHAESQGSYTLEEGTFADDYHLFGIEWEPGEIRYYVDGKLYHKVNDWYTKVEGGDEVTYPAPFDQPFYLICNLAVGGNWPGNPDETTDFNNAEFKVDYIKAYQLDSYDENVKKPEKEVILRDPDGNGNYVINGDFSEDKNWEFMTALNGKGSSEIADNKIKIKTENPGTVDYSIQLVQAGIPLKEGGQYRVSFDAKASEDRTMIVDISGPDKSYVRYFDDTSLDLTTEVKNYSYEFTMEKEDDANGRLEFNLGNQGSTADVEISNVKIEKIGQIEKEDDGLKKIMPDGNYVNNGTFDVGENRMKYWEVESKVKDAEITVTNSNNLRELKVNVKDNKCALEDVIVKQTDLAMKENTKYVLYFDAYAQEDKDIVAKVAGETFDANITTDKQTYKFEFKTGDTLDNKNLELLLGAAGITYIDNVRIEENSIIRNGQFDAGLTGWELFKDSSVASKASAALDSLSEKNAIQVKIDDTGDADWKIQFKQNNVKLEKGKKYKLTFDAKSTLDRDIMYAIQRDGSSDNNWDAYTGSNVIRLGKDYETYELGFEMMKDTDSKSIFTISMGAVGGKQITDTHTVTIDNVKVEEVDELDNFDNALIKNGDFSKGNTGWGVFADGSADAESDLSGGNANINIKDTGDADWKIQLKQENVKLEQGKKYRLSFDVESSIDRTIQYNLQENGGGWTPYSQGLIELNKDEKKEFEVTFVMDKADESALFNIAMGAVGEKQITEEHTIIIDNIILEEIPVSEEIPVLEEMQGVRTEGTGTEGTETEGTGTEGTGTEGTETEGTGTEGTE